MLDQNPLVQFWPAKWLRTDKWGMKIWLLHLVFRGKLPLCLLPLVSKQGHYLQGDEEENLKRAFWEDACSRLEAANNSVCNLAQCNIKWSKQTASLSHTLKFKMLVVISRIALSRDTLIFMNWCHWHSPEPMTRDIQMPLQKSPCSTQGRNPLDCRWHANRILILSCLFSFRQSQSQWTSIPAPWQGNDFVIDYCDTPHSCPYRGCGITQKPGGQRWERSLLPTFLDQVSILHARAVPWARQILMISDLALCSNSFRLQGWLLR